MKKLLVFSIITFGCSTTVFAENVEQNISIKGEVYTQTCKFDNGARNKIVSLDRVKLDVLKNNSKEVPVKDIIVSLTGCDTKNTGTISVGFGISPYLDGGSGNLNNALSDKNTSTGVQIKLLKDDGAHLNLAKPEDTQLLRISQRMLNENNSNLKFKATYAIKQGEDPSTGTISSSVPLVLVYE